MDFKKIQKKAIKDLQFIIDGIRKIEFISELSYSFNTQDIRNNQFIDEFLGEIKNKIDHTKFNYIYTVSLADNCQVSNVYESYKAAKTDRVADRAYARLNQNESQCLYVGSSQNLVPRIKQHLGYGPKGTYAMQLCHWCENSSFDVNIKIYAFSNKTDKKTFQAFEDTVWESLRPMFGRQGKK